MKSALSKMLLSYMALMIFSFSSCQQEEDDIVESIVTEETEGVSQNAMINRWVYETMSNYYYWSEDVMVSSTVEQYPEDYFYSQLNEADRFSFITDDYQGLMEEFSGVYASMGYSLTFGQLAGTNEVFIVVEYVYPDSPAQRMGIERGDIILAVNGQVLNTENYYDLYSADQYTVTLGTYEEEEGFTMTDEVLSLSAEVIETDPVLHKEIISTAGHVVGYLVYAEFISGDNQQWVNSLTIALDEFDQVGVTDVVVDLRYNPGGEIEVAQYLASALAPTSVVSSEEVLVRYDYNEALENSIIFFEGEDSENIVTNYIATGHNLNMNQVYFLTTSNTASASEMLISGLDPYMDVIIVGESTVGKFYGSWIIPDLEEPARHEWAVMPIVLKYTNALGLSDFSEGLTPDYAVEDDLLLAKPFGDSSDPLLGTALSLIAGRMDTRVTTHGDHKPYTDLKNPVKSQKSKLLLPTQ